VVLLGLNSPLAAVAAIFHTMNHATFKASLFMATGVIDHETGTRDLRRLSGLLRIMPITATAAMVAAAAMAGVPLLNGFLSKEMFFAEALEVSGPLPFVDRALPYVATAAGMFSVAYSLRFIHGAFFGPDPVDLPQTPHEPPRWMRFPIEVLVVVCLVVGIFPAFTIGPLLEVAVQAVLGAQTPAYQLKLWHGFNLPLLMSAGAMAGGVALYLLLLRRLASGVEGTPILPPLDGRRVFDRLMNLTRVTARRLEATLDSGHLQPQLRWIVALATVAMLLPAIGRGLAPGEANLGEVDLVLALLWLIGAACAVGAAMQAKFHRLVAVGLAGGAGLATCITFVWFSAPDLALTQLLVEIVTTVLLLLGLRWLPKRLPFASTRAEKMAALPRRALDLALSIGFGGGLAALAYAAMTRPLPESVSREFIARAYPEGGGTNVVNVILVDFRDFDPFGEITVLAIAGIAVYALLRRFRPAAESTEPPSQQRSYSDAEAAVDTQVPAVIMRLMFPVTVLLALYLLVRGHNLPGGGFVAGLTLAVALILQYMAGGTRWVEARLDIRPLRWIALGLLLSAATGAGAWLFGHPFLTSHVAHFTLPGLGEVHLPSAIFFDLGVFALVVGATVLVLIALAHQSLRGDRRHREL